MKLHLSDQGPDTVKLGNLIEYCMKCVPSLDGFGLRKLVKILGCTLLSYIQLMKYFKIARNLHFSDQGQHTIELKLLLIEYCVNDVPFLKCLDLESWFKFCVHTAIMQITHDTLVGFTLK